MYKSVELKDLAAKINTFTEVVHITAKEDEIVVFGLSNSNSVALHFRIPATNTGGVTGMTVSLPSQAGVHMKGMSTGTLCITDETIEVTTDSGARSSKLVLNCIDHPPTVSPDDFAGMGWGTTFKMGLLDARAMVKTTSKEGVKVGYTHNRVKVTMQDTLARSEVTYCIEGGTGPPVEVELSLASCNTAKAVLATMTGETVAIDMGDGLPIHIQCAQSSVYIAGKVAE